jgi:4-amino-4-deoxy-L-arabinose transferase-like glycosyltransferase
MTQHPRITVEGRRKANLPGVLYAIVLLFVMFALMVYGSRQISYTSDEPAHVAVGYAHLARGKAAFWVLPQHGHPPLLNVLEAALLYVENSRIPLEQLDGWGMWLTDYVRAFTAYLVPIERIEIITRLPIILLTVLLGATVFRWGRDLWGAQAGLLALAALVFDPLLVAHGQLATTDVGAVTFGTAALYLTWRWMERPAWRIALGMGSLLGLTMLAKGSGLFWTATVGLLVLVTLFCRPMGSRIGLLLVQGVVIGTLGFLILWAGHAFTWGKVRDLPIPLPAPDHWNGLISQAASVEKRWVFALEERKHGQWWWYFPLAFAIKNPLPLLIGLALGLVTLAQRRPSRTRTPALMLFPILYTGFAIYGGMNIGYRHMLPVHPFIYLAIGGGVWSWAWGQHPRLWRRLMVGALGVWYLVGFARMFPYEIAFFNELIGGPRNGHHYLIDSNIDWGQGYKALRAYLKVHPGPVPQVAYHFTNVNPGFYGIEHVALPPEITAPPIIAPFHPRPGRYVISVTALQRGWPEDPDAYAWFRQTPPTAELAYSFFVYDIDPPPLEWFGQCTVPAAPLIPELVALGFGQKDLRRIYFDCTSAWLYPGGGEQPGAYGLHHEIVPEKAHTFPSLLPSLPQATDAFIARRLADLRLSFDMRRYTRQFPAFVLYEQERTPSMPSPQSVAALPVATLPSKMTLSQMTPLALDGPLTFLGATVYPDGTGLDVETWWQVTQAPGVHFFSIMGHLLTTQGEVLSVADGLGVSPEMLRAGDILVQRHRFPAARGTAFWLRTGAYWLDSMERWTVAGVPGADALFVPVEVSR